MSKYLDKNNIDLKETNTQYVPLAYQYSDEEFMIIVNNSYSMKEVALKLGYAEAASSIAKIINARIDELSISTNHFRRNCGVQKRSPENIFVENSTAAQNTVRRYYRNGQYTDYECAICGLQAEWNGQPLTLILDHINGKNHDDRLENLRWVCPNCNQQLDTTGSKKMKLPEFRKPTKQSLVYCCDCGTKITKGALRCKSCQAKLQSSLHKPLRDMLKQMIRNQSFVAIGKQYGVSDNTIKKWCKAYDLPWMRSEIVKISDEDWEKV